MESAGAQFSDPNDFVIAETYLAFLDLEYETSPDTEITLKSFVDGYEREKYSTYGYAEYGENITLEEKLVIDQSVEPLGTFPLQLSYGVSARYEDSLALTDYTVEPFSRRDLTQPIDPYTVLPAGSDISPAGTTYWDPFGSNESEL